MFTYQYKMWYIKFGTESEGEAVDYREIMDILSQCGLGAVLLSDRDRILQVNETGMHLLHGEDSLTGKLLDEIAPQLCLESEEPLYTNIAFGEYLLRCPTPQVDDLPERTHLVVFRNAADDACHDMLISVMNQITEAVALYDAKGRVYMLNDAVVKMESVVTKDVLGEAVEDIYEMRDGTQLTIPEVLHTKRPLLNNRQYYTTRYGKNIDVMSNTYPITQNGQLLGAFTVMEDWHMVDDLHRQIIELQGRLLERCTSKQSTNALPAKYRFKDICYTSASMHRVVEQCRQVAKSDSSVMICGETGTGKELFAQSIHNASRRADGPFLAINCAAIPENLLEGLLFGTERGAYTGAERRAGLFEQANSGTLLLDELNSMNPNLQSKLLRVLQDGTFRRVGGSAEIQADVRIVSNINIPPYQAIEENKLRRDLFYRLGVVNISIPPLRERKEDIPLLAKTFIIQYNKRLVKNVKDISRETLERFQNYDWPGNVRELQHAIEHAMNVLPDTMSVITPEYLPELILAENGRLPEGIPVRHSLSSAVQDMEYHAVCQALRASGGNISAAAKSLHMSRQNLQYRIKRYQIDLKKLLGEPEL